MPGSDDLAGTQYPAHSAAGLVPAPVATPPGAHTAASFAGPHVATAADPPVARVADPPVARVADPPAAQVAGPPAGPAAQADGPTVSAGRPGTDAGHEWYEGDESAAPSSPEHGVAWHRVTQRRSFHTEQHPSARVIQARRRLLTMLATLVVVALAATAAGLTPWWTLAPPAGVLGLYLLLLREAAIADEEQEQFRSQQRAALAEAASQRAQRTWPASQPQPTAEIIDISARVTDQLYDQYADAAVRAVGD
jgi:hypothetical protein